MNRHPSARISPTAHYTGFVWYRHGISPESFRTRLGWLLFHALAPVDAASRAMGGPSLEPMLLARHRLIDHLLGAAIERGEIGQVIELACGLSPRGERFMRRYGGSGLVYVEGDLPAMAARKRELLCRARAGARAATGLHNHHVVELDALADSGAHSLAAVGGRLLDPALGTAIITEGLISYFDRTALEAMWQGFAAHLGRYVRGTYLSDLYLADEALRSPRTRTFIHLLSLFARGRVHVHFVDAEAAAQALARAGFGATELHRPMDFAGHIDVLPGAGATLVRVLEARQGR